jgi:hypothetical protein
VIVRAAQPDEAHSSARTVEAVDGSGKVRGSIRFDDWRPNSAQVHVECDEPLALRRLLPIALHLGFVEMKLGVVLGHIRAGALAARRLAVRIGFRLACVVRQGWAAGEDLLIYELRPEWCAYGKAAHHGRKRTTG